MSIKTILTPIDFSDCSVNALKTAIRLSKKAMAKLIIVHAVNDELVFGDMGYTGYTKPFLQESEDKANSQFLELAETLPELEALDYGFSVSHDLIEDSIALIEKTRRIDLVVMGTRGASGMRSMLFGSHTYWVIKNVKSPVLAIPENIKIDRFSKIVLASEYHHTAPKATFEPLIDMVKMEEAALQILHVSADTELSEEKADEAWTIENYFEELDHSYYFKNDSHTEEGLVDYIRENNIKLLVVVFKKRKLLERLFHISLTKKLAFHLTIPLLILHE